MVKKEESEMRLKVLLVCTDKSSAAKDGMDCKDDSIMASRLSIPTLGLALGVFHVVRDALSFACRAV